MARPYLRGERPWHTPAGQKSPRVAKGLHAGVIWANCYNVFVAAMPFGGYKMSGYGRESGMHALDLYTQVKAVWMKVE
ncbi:MAG: aldehyde dehydrogenase family protein [Candidatus Methylomirabilales bacterium]